MAKKSIQPLDLSALNLDWTLAAKRLNKDLRDDFWPDPIHFRDLLHPSQNTAARLDSVLRHYKPTRAVLLSVPKANFTIRESFYLAPLDRLVYQALVDRLIPHVDPRLSTTVHSHRLRSPDNKFIFKSPTDQWSSFESAVRRDHEARPGNYLVVTDIAHYFETVRFRVARKQLESILENSPDDIRRCIPVLVQCLQAWSPHDGAGLAQNIDASSFLGNVVLDYIDKVMERAGYRMQRYMDDIRIVVRSEAEARKALVLLVQHLREIHLGLNSAKTKILGPDSPELAGYLGEPDADIDCIEASIKKKTVEAVQAIVPRVFSKARSLLESNKTDHRHFRFCLNRIATLRRYRNLELPDCRDLTTGVLEALVRRPAQTDTYCRYLELSPLESEDVREIERLLTTEPLCVYSWQNHLLWRLATQRRIQSAALVARAHALVSPGGTPEEVAAAALYLGACGDYADRQKVRHALSGAPNSLTRRHISIALQELHRSERTVAWEQAEAVDSVASQLTSYLEQVDEPRYVEDPPPIGLEDLPYEMPAAYA